MKSIFQNNRSFGIAVVSLVSLFFIFQNCSDVMPGPLGRAQQPVDPAPVITDPVTTLTPEELCVQDGGEIDVNGNCVQPEIDPEPPEGLGGPGAPSAPTGFRALLIGNNWSELKWEASIDSEGPIMSYLLYRDGVPIRRISRSYDANDAREAERYWKTRTYIDCNFTRYDVCKSLRPEPGSRHIYHLTAEDEDGNQSVWSQPLRIQYHPQDQAPLDRASIENDYQMVFREDFNGPSLDATQWMTSRPWDDPGIGDSDQRVINQEMQHLVDIQNNPGFGYNPFQFTNENGIRALAITGSPTPQNLLAEAQNQPYLSGIISTRKSFNFQYGFVEARIKGASTAGALSNFFLLNSQYQLGRAWAAGEPEIDILEYLGLEVRNAYQNYHYSSLTADLEKLTHSAPTESFVYSGENFAAEYHTVSVLWEPELVVWYIDDKEVRRLSGPEVSHESMYIVFSLIIGSEWAGVPPAGAEFPARYEVDHVTVYQRPDE